MITENKQVNGIGVIADLLRTIGFEPIIMDGSGQQVFFKGAPEPTPKTVEKKPEFTPYSSFDELATMFKEFREPIKPIKRTAIGEVPCDACGKTYINCLLNEVTIDGDSSAYCKWFLCPDCMEAVNNFILYCRRISNGK